MVSQIDDGTRNDYTYGKYQKSLRGVVENWDNHLKKKIYIILYYTTKQMVFIPQCGRAVNIFYTLIMYRIYTQHTYVEK